MSEEGLPSPGDAHVANFFLPWEMELLALFAGCLVWTSPGDEAEEDTESLSVEDLGVLAYGFSSELTSSMLYVEGVEGAEEITRSFLLLGTEEGVSEKFSEISSCIPSTLNRKFKSDFVLLA